MYNEIVFNPSGHQSGLFILLFYEHIHHLSLKARTHFFSGNLYFFKKTVESVMEDAECAVCFNGKWFRDRDAFYKDACIGNTKLTAVYDDLYGFRVKGVRK